MTHWPKKKRWACVQGEDISPGGKGDRMMAQMNVVAELSAGVLLPWQNFYMIAGTSGGALIGLQFVVITLVASERKKTAPEAINTYGTPTVVYFSEVLAVSAVMSMPWTFLWAPLATLEILSACGFIYAIIIFRRARREQEYEPLPEDWFWYIGAPCGLHAALAFCTLFLAASEFALFGVALATLGLLFVGIRNAWDTVTFVVTGRKKEEEKKAE